MRGLSQVALAKEVGMSQARLSQFERHVRLPNLQEYRRLSNALGACLGPLEGRTPLPYPQSFWFRAFTPDGEGNGSSARRLFAARRRYPKIVDGQLPSVLSRPDWPTCQRFLDQARLDSSTELLFWLALLKADGRPCWQAPTRVGFRLRSVVDEKRKVVIGDIRQPCLELKMNSLDALFFPQLTLDARRAFYRLDALACLRRKRRRLFLNLEIDGRGHDPEYDQVRQTQLGLRTVRLDTDDVTSPDLIARLERCFDGLL